MRPAAAGLLNTNNFVRLHHTRHTIFILTQTALAEQRTTCTFGMGILACTCSCPPPLFMGASAVARTAGAAFVGVSSDEEAELWQFKQTARSSKHCMYHYVTCQGVSGVYMWKSDAV